MFCASTTRAAGASRAMCQTKELLGQPIFLRLIPKKLSPFVYPNTLSARIISAPIFQRPKCHCRDKYRQPAWDRQPGRPSGLRTSSVSHLVGNCAPPRPWGTVLPCAAVTALPRVSCLAGIPRIRSLLAFARIRRVLGTSRESRPVQYRDLYRDLRRDALRQGASQGGDRLRSRGRQRDRRTPDA